MMGAPHTHTIISRAELAQLQLEASRREFRAWVTGLLCGFAVGFAPMVPELVRRVLA